MTGNERSTTHTPPAAHAVRWRLRDGVLDLSTPRIMAICNVTPDSFSDGGEHYSVDLAVRYAESALRDGAVLLDIGGESTRPGATPVSVAQELARVIPVVEAVREQVPSLFITVDTVKSAVAEAALAAGAHAINDVSGGRLDPEMFAVVARTGAGMVVMHSRGDVSSMATYALAAYGTDVTLDVCTELAVQITRARHAGIDADAIVIDPGLGFSKASEHSLMLLRQLSQIVALGYPVLVGASRKRFVGELVGESDPSRRALGSAVVHAFAVARGARIVRTHDVRETREALSVAAAV